jgi:hemoglobin-like flavoprotein
MTRGAMDHETRRLVQHSWTLVAKKRASAVDVFYGKLFETDPALQSLFKGDLGKQKQSLMEMFNVVVRGLDKLDEIIPPLRALGKRHEAYGVLPEHYDTMGVAFLFMLEHTLGEEFTPEVADAWTRTFAFFANAMKEGATGHS